MGCAAGLSHGLVRIRAGVGAQESGFLGLVHTTYSGFPFPSDFQLTPAPPDWRVAIFCLDLDGELSSPTYRPLVGWAVDTSAILALLPVWWDQGFQVAVTPLVFSDEEVATVIAPGEALNDKQLGMIHRRLRDQAKGDFANHVNLDGIGRKGYERYFLRYDDED